jgi:predicted nucleic acid-binding protein
MDKVFIDTHIALELLSERHPHYQAAAQLFTLADKGKIKLFKSSLSFSNLNYLQIRQYNAAESCRILKSLVTIQVDE